jgi:hypothetical protein
MKYKIFAGLGGGFGGANYVETVNCNDEEEATSIAYEHACEEYDGYSGLHGLRDIDQIMEEEQVNEEEAEEIYREDRESWLDYYVELDNENNKDEEEEEE